MTHIESSTQPRCRVYFSSAQSIPDSTPTILTFDSEVFDVGALHDTSTSPSRITIPVDGGLWLIHVQCQFESGNDAASREVRILKNGAAIVAQTVVARGTGSFDDTLPVMVLEEAAASDYYELQVQQTSGVTKNANAGSAVTFFEAVKLW